MATIILLCNENYALSIRQNIESARRQLANGELSELPWSVGKQRSVKVGDRIYIQRTNTYPPAGYFATGYVVSAQPGEQLKRTNKRYADGSIPIMREQLKGKLTIEIGASQLQHWIDGLQVPFCA